MVASHSTCLVTGGAGFIGRSVVAQLLQAEPDRLVVVLDAMTYAAHPAALAALGALGRLEVVEGDIADTQLVDRVMNRFRPGLVINLAAESHVDRSLQDCSPFLRSNVVGTSVLLKAALATRVQRFVQVSTDEVYGDRHGRSPARETDATDPSNPYSISKACADALVLAAVRSHGLDGLITRGCNTYGPGQFPEKLLPLAALRWSQGKPMWVYGDGQQQRTWLHVDDHAGGILAAARGGSRGAIYHLKCGSPRSNEQTLRDWYTALFPGAVGETLLQAAADRPGHDRCYKLSDTVTRRSLAWRPSYSWKQGLAATARWSREHGDFWDRALGHPESTDYFRSQYGSSWLSAR